MIFVNVIIIYPIIIIFYKYSYIYIYMSSPRPSLLQAALDVLTGRFDRVGLRTNINKMVGMVCQTCQMSGAHSEVEYRRRLTGVGPSFHKMQWE